ncbi:MAG: hypothetical protein M1825_004628 [Sarcosagium campestre]|nr:MAG: hypothetical protein M1825_004628 [Sarcosagium campestre]
MAPPEEPEKFREWTDADEKEWRAIANISPSPSPVSHEGSLIPIPLNEPLRISTTHSNPAVDPTIDPVVRPDAPDFWTHFLTQTEALANDPRIRSRVQIDFKASDFAAATGSNDGGVGNVGQPPVPENGFAEGLDLASLEWDASQAQLDQLVMPLDNGDNQGPTPQPIDPSEFGFQGDLPLVNFGYDTPRYVPPQAEQIPVYAGPPGEELPNLPDTDMDMNMDMNMDWTNYDFSADVPWAFDPIDPIELPPSPAEPITGGVQLPIESPFPFALTAQASAPETPVWKAKDYTNYKYRRNTAYPILPTPLAPWSIFKYTRFGELQTAKTYTPEEILHFLYEHPLHTNELTLDKRQSRLRLWIQKSPSESVSRYPTTASARCRFVGCPVGTNSIRVGEYRMCFDEQSWKGEPVDPFLNAGYVHLYCLERFLNLPTIIRDLNVMIDERRLELEKNGVNRMALTGRHIVREANEFFEPCQRGGFPTEYPQLDAQGIRPYPESLCHRLHIVRLNFETSPHQLKVLQASATSRAFHMGDLGHLSDQPERGRRSTFCRSSGRGRSDRMPNRVPRSDKGKPRASYRTSKSQLANHPEAMALEPQEQHDNQVEDNTQIGDNIQVGNNPQVENNIQIEDNTQIGDNNQVEDNTHIGDNIQVGNSTQVENNIPPVNTQNGQSEPARRRSERIRSYRKRTPPPPSDF